LQLDIDGMKRITVILVTTLACSACSTGPTAPSSTPGAGPIPAPRLTAPEEDAFVRQNDPATGCPNDPVWGYGFQVTFAWTPVRNASGYRIYMKHPYASVPVLDEVVPTDRFTFRRCTTVMGHSEGWEWKVLALNGTGQEGEWSESRRLNFTECRIGDVFCGTR
jgi:hypothetical protein